MEERVSPISFCLPRPCHCEECRQARRGNPLGNMGMSCFPTTPSCATRSRGLLRRFEDSLLAMTTMGFPGQCRGNPPWLPRAGTRPAPTLTSRKLKSILPVSRPSTVVDRQVSSGLEYSYALGIRCSIDVRAKPPHAGCLGLTRL